MKYEEDEECIAVVVQEIADYHLDAAEEIIDAKFGEGFARNNPQLLGSITLALTMNLATWNMRDDISRAAKSLSRLEDSLSCFPNPSYSSGI